MRTSSYSHKHGVLESNEVIGLTRDLRGAWEISLELLEILNNLVLGKV
jgi:hypothetical protein